jgi:hypothetical protein
MNHKVASLEEDLQVLGLSGQFRSMQRYSGIEEDVDERDDDRGERLTMSTLNRIQNLDVDSLALEDIDDILENLGEYEVDENDKGLLRATKQTLSALSEARMMKIKSTMGGTRTRAAAGFRKKNGKIVRSSAAERRKTAISGKKYRKRAASKIAKYRSTRGARLLAKRQSRGLMPSPASESLAYELSSLLSESVDFAPLSIDQQIAESIGNVYELLEDILGGSVSDTLLESYQRVESAVVNGTTVEDSLSASLKIIARCLEAVDRVGN